MPTFPAITSRWKWFTRLGAIIKGALGHGWIVDGTPGPYDAGEADMMTLNRILELRTTGGAAAFYQALMAIGAKFSPVYFNAAYHDADELQLNGLPTVPDDVQWVGVIEWLTTEIKYWFQPEYHITYDPATNRIQLDGAAFTAGSQFMAIYVDNQNAYDQVLNAIQIAMLNARQQDYIDTQEIADAENLDFTSDPIIVKAETTIGVYVTWTTADQANGGFTLDIYADAEDTDTGTTWHDVYTGDWEYQGTPAATIVQFNSGLRVTGAQNTTYHFLVRINVNDINRLRLVFDETAPAAGTISAQVVIMNR